MEWLHSKKSFRPDMMKEEPAAALINETYRVLDSAVKSKLKKSVPQELTDHLERDTYYFSGFKTFHELREASALLKGDDGGFKPFDKFLKDVEKIDNTYNKSYLYAEYNFAVQSTQMAVKWKEWEKDGDDYDLQFRTSEDDRVRPEHAALDGTTLPFSDEFWNKYIPPLGWNCRCTTVQVLKGKYPRAESWRAQQLGEAATSGTGEKIFRFNPGKTMKIFPPNHPYYKVPKSAKRNTNEATSKEFAHIQECELKEWYGKNLPKTPQGNRFDVEMSDGKHIFVRKKFYNECISKYKDDELYVTRLLYARRAHTMLQKSTYIGPEPSRDHPDATFSVYQYNGDSKYRVEFKVLCNADGMFLYYMRLYKK